MQEVCLPCTLYFPMLKTYLPTTKEPSLKLAPYQISDFFKTGAPPKVTSLLIHGEDEFYISQKRKEFLKGYFKGKPYQLIPVESKKIQSTPSLLNDTIHTRDLFQTDVRVLVIKSATDGIGALLKEFLKTAIDTDFFIVEADYLNAKSTLRAFYEKDPACVAISCYKPELKDLTAHIQTTVKNAGKEISTSTCQMLAAKLLDEPSVLDSELEKIITYVGGKKTIEDADIQAIVASDPLGSMDRIFQAIYQNSPKLLVENLTSLYADGIPPVAIIRYALGQLMRFHEALAYERGGASLADSFFKLSPPVLPFQQKDFQNQLRGWTEESLSKSIQKLIETEKEAKLNHTLGELLCERALLQVMKGCTSPVAPN